MKPNNSASGVVNGAAPFFTFSNVNAAGSGWKRNFRNSCRARSTIFLICDTCGSAEEFDAGHALVDLGEAAARDGFEIKRTIIEATGVCAACKAA